MGYTGSDRLDVVNAIFDGSSHSPLGRGLRVDIGRVLYRNRRVVTAAFLSVIRAREIAQENYWEEEYWETEAVLPSSRPGQHIPKPSSL